MTDHTQITASDPAIAAVIAERFADALCLYTQTTILLQQHDKEAMTPANARFEAADKSTEEARKIAFDALDKAQDLYGEFVADQSKALRSVLQCDSPTIAALATKLRLWAQHDCSAMEDADQIMNCIAYDAEALARRS